MKLRIIQSDKRMLGNWTIGSLFLSLLIIGLVIDPANGNSCPNVHSSANQSDVPANRLPLDFSGYIWSDYTKWELKVVQTVMKESWSHKQELPNLFPISQHHDLNEYERYLDNKKNAPFFKEEERLKYEKYVEERHRVGKKWLEWAQRKTALLPDLKDSISEMVEVTAKGKSPVYRVRITGEIYFLRLATDRPEDVDSARLTWMAADLNSKMGLDTVPKAELVLFGGHVGVLSKSAIGKQGQATPFGATPPKTKPSSDSLANVQGFEYFYGNDDVHSANYAVSDQGNVQVFDHGNALYPAIPLHSKMYIAGKKLPDAYTPALKHALLTLFTENHLSAYQPFMTTSEYDGLIFRYHMLTTDMKLRQRWVNRIDRGWRR